jgi:type I restriction enzyme M protein
MPLTGCTETQIAQYEQQLLAQVPEDGAVGNRTLFRNLQRADGSWTEELFWAIRNRLIERGLLERGRGKGGSVRKPKTIAPGKAAPRTAEPIAAQIRAERDLYEPMGKVIKETGHFIPASTQSLLRSPLRVDVAPTASGLARTLR